MKTTIAGLLVLAVVGGTAVYLGQQEAIVPYTKEYKEDSATSTVPIVEVAIDPLDEAQEALDRANKLLDEEEAKLLEQRNYIDARLEEIVKKRSAF